MAKAALTFWFGVSFLSLSAQAGPQKKTCAQILADLGVTDVFHTQPHFRKALEKVLNARLAKGTIPPLDESVSETKKAGDELFQVSSKTLPVEREIPGHTDWEDAGESTEDVFTFEHDGKTFYFRPIQGGFNLGTQARKTMATTLLNQALKLETVPRAVWAKVNGELGSLSEEAPGTPFSKYWRFEEILSQFAEHRPEVLANLAAFEFLIGNKDAVRRNAMVNVESASIQVFDHDNAYLAGLVPVTGENAEEPREVLFGTTLPERYTATFVKELKALTPPKLKKLLRSYLSDVEIEGIIFRREIILEDLKLRKPELLEF